MFIEELNQDVHATVHKENLYYPWASQQEWELASFLLCSSLSMATIDQFLSLDLVSCLIWLLFGVNISP